MLACLPSLPPNFSLTLPFLSSRMDTPCLGTQDRPCQQTTVGEQEGNTVSANDMGLEAGLET